MWTCFIRLLQAGRDWEGSSIRQPGERLHNVGMGEAASLLGGVSHAPLAQRGLTAWWGPYGCSDPSPLLPCHATRCIFSFRGCRSRCLPPLPNLPPKPGVGPAGYGDLSCRSDGFANNGVSSQRTRRPHLFVNYNDLVSFIKSWNLFIRQRRSATRH